MKPVEGFSKKSKEQKIAWLLETYLQSSPQDKKVLDQYLNQDDNIQKLHEEFSENTLTNFYIPFGIAPNFLINQKLYAIPMAIEESSVVAAACKSAKFWLDKGGFKTKVLSVVKVGQVHFTFKGEVPKLQEFFRSYLYSKLFEDTQSITENMQNRGGGIINIELKDKTADLEDYFQLYCEFETVDSMGANFINSCLEQFSKTLEREIQGSDLFSKQEKESLTTIMCILSNYTPECIVRASVKCEISQLSSDPKDAELFAYKFKQAVEIANVEPYRAITHNKGIMNGVDAVVIATGNDFRATEACAHGYASRSGKYKSLTHCSIEDNQFEFWIDLPISIGTVGGLTQLHPLAKLSMKILQNPTARELMEIIAVAGLAQNFAALQSLVTSGIQKGHMKMHLLNILNSFGANEKEKEYFIDFFKDKTVSYHLVEEELSKLREKA
ncbi:MAG: hydroxymethylglutaryl-CoA reductase, degradative [Flavobacteriaceae bacterium]|nr:MAG: hydroxymethylglutaryl-CoA reductase, degradative [Flavobacteriaceae bacterium]